MITGKTSSGFAFSVREDVGRDWRVMRAIADGQNGDTADKLVASVRLVELLLGKTGADALCAHVAEPDGFVPAKRIDEEVTEIFKSVSAENRPIKKLITLAAMISEDREALLCDLAETYGIFDMRALPLDTAAALACGLPAESRIKRRMSGEPPPADILILAGIFDRVGLILWGLSEDGRHNRNRPKSVVERLLGTSNSNGNYMSYASPEDFEAARASILKGANNEH